MLPCAAGAVPALSGMNVSYKSSALASIRRIFREEFFETFVNEHLKEQGYELYLQPAAIVYHQKKYQLGEAFKQCYHLARSFAARRVHNSSHARRASFMIGSLALPVLLPLRIFLTVMRKKRHLKEMLLSLPLLITLMGSWSFGEFCGYLLGEGASAEAWR
jgi:GT2 family glycosyltransferase